MNKNPKIKLRINLGIVGEKQLFNINIKKCNVVRKLVLL